MYWKIFVLFPGTPNLQCPSIGFPPTSIIPKGYRSRRPLLIWCLSSMYKLNLMATFWLLHLKFTGSRIIVISWVNFMKMNGLILNYILGRKKISNWLRKCKIPEYFSSFMHYEGGGVFERQDVYIYTNIVLDSRWSGPLFLYIMQYAPTNLFRWPVIRLCPT